MGARRRPGHARRRCVALAEGEHDPPIGVRARLRQAPRARYGCAGGSRRIHPSPQSRRSSASPARTTHPHAAFDPATAVALGQSVVDGKNQRDHRLRPSAPPAGAECTRPVPISRRLTCPHRGPPCGLAVRCQQRALGPVLVLAELRASHRRSAPGRTEQESGIGARFEGGRGTTRRGGCITAGPRRPSHRARWFRRARPPSWECCRVAGERPGVDLLVHAVVRVDLAADHGLRGYLPGPRAVRMGQGAVGAVHHRHTVAGSVGLPDRSGAVDERAGAAQAQRQDQAFRQYVHETASSPPSVADELAKLADLRDAGTISKQEFAQAKARLLDAQPPVTPTSRAAHRATTP